MKISAYIFSIVLTSLLLFNSTRVTFTYAYYNLDPVGFVEALCENKDQPELECNGKCHLKKVAKSQDKDQKTPESIIDFKELTLFSNAFEAIVFLQKKTIKKQNPIVYQNLYSFNNTNVFFHPPQA
ncbi:hypothetical protein [Psychroserpens ponticola]|uniref:Uncharacterized protein n=1 Tax=Psychroserpens ponticola TaxID=2932268 RepID=A0ABY7S0P5_9FLAO|nr:hypothetical protein [Psychroserpens ponticola]WCO02868.1 hypothetical protein MUN68_005095 [Psychroserpens ponticola]